MLKTHLLLIIGVLLFKVTSSQNLKVTYSIEINDVEDFAPKDSKKEDILEFTNYIDGLRERMSQVDIIVNSNKKREYNVSTIKGMAIGDNFMFNMDMKMIGLSSFIQGNSKESYGFDDNRGFAISYNYDELIKWNITNETKIIQGYHCTKALIIYRDKSLYTNTTPREFWFTTELNFNGGPSVFSGLPGLIMQVKTPITTITASNIESNRKPLKKNEIESNKTKTYKKAQIYFKKGADAIRSRM